MKSVKIGIVDTMFARVDMASFAIDELKHKFPTGALAVLALPAWAEAGPGAGRLKEFVRPRDLS